MALSSYSTPRIFISHSHEDNDFGIKLAEDLCQALGDETAAWYDANGGLQVGESWWRKIQNELTARSVFIVVLSPDAMASKWVNDEIDIAWAKHNSPRGMLIIPVLYRQCEIRPDLMTLQLISFQAHERYDIALKKLLAALKKTTKQITPSNPYPGYSQHPPIYPSPLPNTYDLQQPISLSSSQVSEEPFITAPILRQPKRQRSTSVFAVLLTLILLGGGSFGIYGAATGRWLWNPSQGPSTPTNIGVAGRTWHIQPSSTSKDLSAVTWSGSQFVAAGMQDIIFTSSDGRTWTAQSSVPWVPFGNIAGVARSGSQFVAVGGFLTSSIIFTSPDGRTWTAQHSDTVQHLWAVTGSDSQFVAVGYNGTILTSPDGRTWTAQHSNTAQHLWAVTWLDSQFVAVGANGTILTSPDGRTWTAQHSGTTESLDGVAWSDSQFVTVGANGTILTSPDGHTWTLQNSGTEQHLDGVAGSDSQFVVVGLSGIVLTSPDGRTWTEQHSPTSENLASIVWSGSQFVAVGARGTILTSP